MVAFIDKLVARWKYERQRMKEILEGRKFGESKVEPWPPIPGQVDTTPGDIEVYTRKIAEMDALIARHPEAK
jgi:hypothetical protein